MERPAGRGRTASAGWYNVAEVHRQAAERDRQMVTINGDCFADATKARVIDALREIGPAGLLVYSVASPVRVDPITGETYRSVLKPTGRSYATKTLSIDTGNVTVTELAAATSAEVAATVKVMGGDDWERWIDALAAADLLGPKFRSVAFSYLGPQLTHPIYRSGTIGAAKAHLETTAQRLHERLALRGGGAWVSINAAAVTQSSTAIPAVPLYLSLLLSVAAKAGVFQTPMDQIVRLFEEHLGPDVTPSLDDKGRIRLDDWELSRPVQDEIAARWKVVTSSNLQELGDYGAFRQQFRRMFGFDVDGIDYEQPINPDVAWPA